MNDTSPQDEMVPAYETAMPGPIEDGQRPGNPERGYDYLLNKPYVSCGFPARIYDQIQGQPSEASVVSGRNEINKNRAYFETEYTNADGLQAVTTNCLVCHAGYLDGKLTIGSMNARTTP